MRRMNRWTTSIGAGSLALLLATPLMAQGLRTSPGETPWNEEGAPAPWLQEDPGSDAYARAREALNERQYAQAANLFQELRARYPTSGYVGDSYYWQAFALYREGGRTSYQRATELLDTQAQQHPNATTRGDADELRVRIEAQLAQRGDARAAAAIAQQAAVSCSEEDQELRIAALSALINMNADQAIPILREVLQSRDSCSAELRQQAVFVIAQKMTDQSVDILLDLAQRNPDPDPEVREQAVFWLSQVDSDEAVDALASILRESDDPELQEQALFALSQHSGDRAWDILTDFSRRSDADPGAQANAIFWIGQSSRGEATTYLREIYRSLQDPELKDDILMSVAQSEDPERQAWLMERVRDPNEDLEIRKSALFWMGQAGGIQASQLSELFHSFEDPEMQEQVIFVASQAGNPEAVDFLMDVARTAEDKDVREQAIFWLGQSKDPRVPEFLLSLIRG